MSSTDHSLPLFSRWPRLSECLPWIPIGNWPTAVSPAVRFAAEHRLSSFWIKHEDRSHPIAGGNKVRGLEFLLAHAKSVHARTLVTMGAAGSYHICRTAFHAHPLGIRTVAVVVPQPGADYVRQNLAVGQSRDVEFLPAGYLSSGPLLIRAMLTPSNWAGGRPPYFIPPGGSSPRACLGHVSAAFELRDQIAAGVLPEPDYLFVAMGSLGTAAGLMLGCKLAGLHTRIVGVAVSYRWYCTPGRCARMAARILRFLRRGDSGLPEIDLDRGEVDVVSEAIGTGYAAFTEQSLRLARHLHECEGVALDGTYTAKTLDGAMRFIERRQIHDKHLLFWNSYHPTLSVEASEGEVMHPSLQKYFTEPAQELDALLRR